MSQQTTVVHARSHSEHRVVEGSVVPPNIFLNNCPDVHIGPKYVHTNNITINQGLACIGDTESADSEVVVNSFRSVSHKCLKVPFGVRLKIIFYGSSFLLIILITITVILLDNSNNIDPWRTTPRPTLPPDNSEDYPLDKRFVTRDTWGASQPCKELINNTLPLERVVFIHTVNSATCNTFASCKKIVFDIQDMHMEKCGPDTLDDIMYNFVIGSDGYIFVGRGWDKRGMHTCGNNTGNLGVAFIGDFRTDEPSSIMLNSAKTLLEFGVERAKLSEDYQLLGHCQLRLKWFPFSPGINILRKIQTWPHWNSLNAENCVGFNSSYSVS